MTDLLGICTAWGDGRCVVVPETGEPVTIALADIVSGKPVPPRPSVRHRVSTRDAEEHTLSLWPGLVTERLGDWVLRTDPAPTERLFKRANSCLAIGDPATDLATAAARVREFYDGRWRRPLAQVERGSANDAGLVALGWSPVAGGDSHFLLGSLSRARRALGHPPTADDARRVDEGGDRVLVELEGAARGRAALHGDWLGLHGLTVDERQRRRGLASGVVAALLEWGAERGATTVWLHVEVDNAPALALYEGLGLGRHHACRYLVPPGR